MNRFLLRCKAVQNMLNTLAEMQGITPEIEDAQAILEVIIRSGYNPGGNLYFHDESIIEEAMFLGFKKHRIHEKYYEDFIKAYLPPMTDEEIIMHYKLNCAYKYCRECEIRRTVIRTLVPLFEAAGTIIEFEERKK